MDVTKPFALVFAKQANASLLSAALSGSCICATSRSEYYEMLTRGPAVAFVDFDLLPQVDGDGVSVPVVGILDDTLVTDAVRSLDSFPWLSHLVSATMLSTPLARPHLAMLLERLESGPDQRVLGAAGGGRAALLANSTHREARFERMREFFSKRGLTARTIASMNDVAEELVTNALYDAPLEGGYFEHPVPRTEDVNLPPERACEISYGAEQDFVFVRIRDPFGGLTRARLLGVLNRCNTTSVSLDESRGGAGLGLWRIFSTASSIDITVIPGRLTDIVVRVETKKGRAVAKQLLAVNLFFVPDEHEQQAHGRFAGDSDYDLMDESFTMVLVA